MGEQRKISTSEFTSLAEWTEVGVLAGQKDISFDCTQPAKEASVFVYGVLELGHSFEDCPYTHPLDAMYWFKNFGCMQDLIPPRSIEDWEEVITVFDYYLRDSFKGDEDDLFDHILLSDPDSYVSKFLTQCGLYFCSEYGTYTEFMYAYYLRDLLSSLTEDEWDACEEFYDMDKHKPSDVTAFIGDYRREKQRESELKAKSKPKASRRSASKSNGSKDGWIYAASNPTLPGILKIGLTTRTPEQRIDELSSSTSVAIPFELVHSVSISSEKLKNCENLIHRKLNKYRVNPKREFFKVDSTLAINTMNQARIEIQAC
jgi:hypothetical protein